MKLAEVKAVSNALKELSESYDDLFKTLTAANNGVKVAKKLWRGGNSTILIKLGLALIAFPEPIISDFVGSLLVAAGAVQMGIRRHAIYVEDVYKTFQNTMREIWKARDNL